MGEKLHDDFCERTRFRNARCTCGGDEGQSYSQIVRDTIDGFAADMRHIMNERAIPVPPLDRVAERMDCFRPRANPTPKEG